MPGFLRHKDSTGAIRDDMRAYPLPTGGISDAASVDLVLDTNAYADGDTLSDLYTLTGAVLEAGKTVTLQDLLLIDTDDQGQPLEVLIFNGSVTLSNKNASWNTSDSDMLKCLAFITIEASEYVDLGGNRIVQKTGLGIVLKPASGTSLYLATRSRGTGTYTANGIRIKLGLFKD